MEALRALGALVEPPGEATTPLARAVGIKARLPDPSDYTDLFVFQLYPYASVYLGAEGMLGGEARGRVAGFWSALGLTPPAEPDHLTALLGLYAALAEDGSRQALHARKALLWEHLLSWLPYYLERVEEVGIGFYADWARLLRAVLLSEAKQLGPPAVLPLHLREAPALAHPDEEGGEAFLGSLLAPVRTGMILVRSDLVRCARELGLGLRVGERSYVLRALFSQAPDELLQWLADHARASANRHRAMPATLRAVSGFWAERADSAAALLTDVRTAARKKAYAG